MKKPIGLLTGLSALVLTASIAWAGAIDDALTAFEGGEWAKARASAAKVAEDDADFAKARYLVGECLLMERDWDAATAAFEQVLERNPEAVPALTGLGRAKTAAGELDAAEATLEKAVALDTKDAAARRSLGELRLAQDDLKAALRDLSAAFKLNESDTQTARALVDVQLRLDRIKGARATARKIAKTRPKHPMGHFLLGWVHDRENDDDEAIAEYEKAIALDDAFLDAHKNLAIVCTARNPTYEDRARTKKAMQHYERYFELGGEDAKLEPIYRQLRGFLEQSGFDVGGGGSE